MCLSRLGKGTAATGLWDGIIMNQNDLTGFIVEIIKERISAGWELPLVVTVMSANGSVMSGTYKPNANRDGVDYEEHVNWSPQSGMQLPIRIVVSKGEQAIKVTLTKDGVGPITPFSNN